MGKFFYQMYTDDAGKPSHSRFILTVVILFACMWVSVIVFAKGILPDLAGLGIFLGAVGTVTYGYSLASSTTQAFAARKPAVNGSTTTTVTTPEVTTEVKT